MKTVTRFALRHLLLSIMVAAGFNTFAQLNINPIADDTIHVICFSGHSTAVNLAPSSIDPDGGALTFQLGIPTDPTAISSVQTGQLTFNITARCISGTPGIDVFIPYTVFDTSSWLPSVASAGGIVWCTIIDSNHQQTNLAPIANDDYFLVDSAWPSTINLLANDYDPNGDKFSAPQIIVFPNSGTAVAFNTVLVFNPNPISKGLDSLVYVVCDTLPHALCDTATAYFYIRGKSNNIAPSLADDFIGTGVNQPVVIHELRNDFDQNGDSLTNVSIIQPASNGAVAINADLTINYTPNPSFIGADTLSYMTCDFNSASAFVSPPIQCDTAVVYIIVSKPMAMQANVHTISCHGNNDGNIKVNVTGGIAPYQLLWSNGSVSDSIFNLSPGTYILTITDAYCTNIIDTFDITEPAKLTASISYKKDVSCFGGNDGSIAATGQGGTTPYLYTWNIGSTNDTLILVSAAIYTVTINDANGCTATALDTIRQPTQLVFNAGADQTICKGTSTMIGNNLGASGGTPVYNYTWSNTGLGPYIPEQNEGLYFITVTDMNGCVALDSVRITFVDFQDSIISPFSDTLTCGTQSLLQFQQANASAVVTNWDFADGGQSPNPSPQHTFTVLGIYDVRLISINNIGCSDTSYRAVSFGQDCVFPGDANYDGLVDNNDLLAIGLAYDSTGPVRANQSLVWAPSYADDWSDTTTWNINRKHADCNGNGVVNANDTVAIMQNWGSTHSKTNERKAYRAFIPALQVVLSPNQALNGDTVEASLQLGDINISASNVYGIAFTFNYTNIVVDSTKTSIEFGPSWLGTAIDKISIAKDFPQQGEIKAAITRIDHTNRSGFGEIGKVKLVINTDNIDGKMYATFPFEAYITSLVATDADGLPLELNEGADTTEINYEPTAITTVAEIVDFSVYPNPANQTLVVSCEKNSAGDFKLISPLGEIIQEWNNVKGLNMNVSNLPTGMYCIDGHFANGQQIKKRVVIAR
ncbi:MAG: T9SS type A sorting domain-containing protein [Chitinophagales bacterium]|nr:T9SS type A sorting domain-containing protein [Chitinophagales bacterium]